jgi:hypothetical protein
MKTNTGKRQSLCAVCGKRLSSKTPSGDIQWQPSCADDEGLYCAACCPPKGKDKPGKDHSPEEEG